MIISKEVKFRDKGKRANLSMPQAWWGKNIKIMYENLPILRKKVHHNYSLNLPIEYGGKKIKIMEV